MNLSRMPLSSTHHGIYPPGEKMPRPHFGLFGSPRLPPIGVGGSPAWGLWGWPNTRHLTADRWLMAVYCKSPIRPHRGCAWERSVSRGHGKQACRRKRWRPGSPGRCDLPVWIILRAGRELTRIRLRTRWATASPAEGNFLLGGKYPERAEELMVRPSGPREAQTSRPRMKFQVLRYTHSLLWAAWCWLILSYGFCDSFVR